VAERFSCRRPDAARQRGSARRRRRQRDDVDIAALDAYIVGMAAAALGEFEVVILLAVLHAAPEAYGTAIRDDISRRSGREPSRGSVYVTLDRLEAKGYLRSTVGDPAPERGGRARRFYQVTRRGLAALRGSLAIVSSMRKGLESVLDPS
jgi:DNA-binding PadR family transcriptional regulator